MARSKIVEALRSLAVPIDSVVLDPANPRRHTGRNLAAIKASLDRFGQRRPVVVQAEGRIVRAGNGRVIAARELGWTEIAAVVVPEGDVEAVAYAVADNRVAEFAEWDRVALKRALVKLGDELEGTGFTSDDLAYLEDDLDVPEEVWTGMPEFEQDEVSPYHVVRVWFRTEEDVRRFEELVGHEAPRGEKGMWWPWIVRDKVTDKRWVDEEDGDGEDA